MKNKLPANEKKGPFISHRFRIIPNYEPYRLFRDCVLRPAQGPPYGSDCRESDVPPGYRVSQVKFLQKQLQQAYMRVFDDDQARRYSLVYDANCVPAGVRVGAPTQACQNAKACVWCFARQRLFRMRSDVKTVAALNPELKLFCWFRDLHYTSDSKKLEFYDRRRGPHQWLDAALTIQTMLPYLAQADNASLTFRHLVVQLIPDSKNLKSRFSRHSQAFGSVAPKWSKPRGVDDDDIRESFQWAMSFNWGLLYARKQHENFKELLFGLKRANLLRVNYDSAYKSANGQPDSEEEASEQAGEEAGGEST